MIVGRNGWRLEIMPHLYRPCFGALNVGGRNIFADASLKKFCWKILGGKAG